MGSFGNVLENEILDHIFGKGAYTPPTIYIGLKTADPTDDNSGGTEPTIDTGGYARIVTDGDDWDAAAAGALANAEILAFAESTDAWSTGATPLTHFILMDAASAGNMLAHGTVPIARTVNTAGVVLRFPVGELDVSLD